MLQIHDAKIRNAYEQRKARGISKKELLEIIGIAKDADGGHYKKSITAKEARHA